MALVDITGMRFSRWLVERIDPTSGKIKFWHCVCDCGTRKLVFGGDLKRGMSKSCGCLGREMRAARMTSHGFARHPAYHSWQHMRTRCENPNDDNFHIYGGRGIVVCAQWRKFEAFWEDMGPTWQDGLSIDRKETDGNYEPSNCRWDTPKDQANNRRSNQIINTPKGPMTISQAAELFGIGRQTLNGRVKSGWPTSRLFDAIQFNIRWHKE